MRRWLAAPLKYLSNCLQVFFTKFALLYSGILQNVRMFLGLNFHFLKGPGNYFQHLRVVGRSPILRVKIQSIADQFNV